VGELFARRFQVGWGDMDFNAHMRNTSYLDRAADTRMMYFESHGFSMRDFERLRIGPVVFMDEIEYRRELRLLETMTVAIELAGVSPDGSNFRIRNTFYRPDEKVAAVVTSEGGWLSIDTRKLVPPPPPLLAALNDLTRAVQFTELESRMGQPSAPESPT